MPSLNRWNPPFPGSQVEDELTELELSEAESAIEDVSLELLNYAEVARYFDDRDFAPADLAVLRLIVRAYALGRRNPRD